MSHKPLAIIVGSQAMKYHFPDFPRIPMDQDLIVRKATFEDVINAPEVEDIIGIEKVTIAEHGLSAIVKFKNCATPYEYLFADGQKSLELILDQIPSDKGYATPGVLYSLKKAHIHFPVKFEKHIKDLMFLRSKLRENKDISLEQDLSSETDLLEEFPALTELHFKETEARVGKLKTPKMSENREKFFGKSKKYVTSYYIHDDMHKAIAEMHQGSPVYQKILKEGAEVETDINLWRQLSIQEKIWCVMEETYVIALERKILPQMFGPYANNPNESHWSAKQAFGWALYRVCTTLCDGFFRDFAVRAYDEIQKQYDPNYVETFFKNISKYEKVKKDDSGRTTKSSKLHVQDNQS